MSAVVIQKAMKAGKGKPKRPQLSANLKKRKAAMDAEKAKGAGVGELSPDMLGEEPSGFEVDPGHLEKLKSFYMESDLLDAMSQGRRATSLNALHGIDAYTYVDHYHSQLETFPRWFLTVARGITGKVKIYYYNLESLVRYSGLASIHLDGTLLTMDNSSWIFVGVLMVTFTFIFVGVHGILEDGKSVDTQDLEAITKNLNQVVPFVLGLYITLALTRWWTVRSQGVAEICAAAVNLQMIVGCCMYPERHKPIRTLVMKWTFASIFLLLKAVRNQPGLNDMIYKEMLSEHEVEILSRSDDLQGRPAILWGWILRLVQESFSEAVGPMPYSIQVSKVAETIMQASNGFNIIEMHLRTALPFVYVHLITLLVDINNLLFVAKTATVAAVGYHEGDLSKVATEIVFCMMVPTLYRGLLNLSAAVFDPFGEDVLDFPMGSIVDWNAQCVKAVISAQDTFPGVPDSVYAATHDRFNKVKDRRRLSQRAPHEFVGLMTKCRHIIINSLRSGKLEKVVKISAMSTAKEAKLGPLLHNAKSSSAMMAATVFAEPLANELKALGKEMRSQLIKVRQEAYNLHRTVDEHALRQRQEIETALDYVQDEAFNGSCR